MVSEHGASNDAAENTLSTPASLGRRLTFLLVSILLLAIAALCIYLVVADRNARLPDVILVVLSVGVAIFALFGLVALTHSLMPRSPVWGAMPVRRFVRLVLASYVCGLAIFFVLDGAHWLRERSWLLTLAYSASIAAVFAYGGTRIRSAVRWLAFGDNTPQKPAS